MAASAAFGIVDGEEVSTYTIKHDEPGGIEVTVTEIGATITSVRVPDSTGALAEVTLGFDEAAPYADGTSPYFGCVAGRCANRICKGKFVLDQKPYSLATNNDSNHLHGGVKGFDKRVWSLCSRGGKLARFQLESSDGDQGYPGCLTATVTYSLPTPTSLKMEYAAVTDAPTLCNLTNHTYWNLTDGGATSVADHTIELCCDFYTPVDDTSIPTGEVRAVSGAMDLRTRVPIGAGLGAADNGNGYDHNFCVSAPTGSDGLRPVARAWEPSKGRWMSVRSDQPGVQFYTGVRHRPSNRARRPTHARTPSTVAPACIAPTRGLRVVRGAAQNFLDGLAGRGGTVYHRHHAFCLETQKFPDSVNRPHFPSVTLRPGERYSHVTVHQFGCSPDAPPEGAW